MIQLIPPDLNLPSDPVLNYSPEIHKWVKENLPGIKYITLTKRIKRGVYDPQFLRINIQEKPTAAQSPNESAEDLLKIIWSAFQYKLEEEDSPGTYKITLYRKMATGAETPKSKHVEIGVNSNPEEEARSYDPDQIDGDLISTQLKYIQMMQDQCINLMGVATEIVGPLIEQNKSLQESNRQLSNNQVELERIRHQAQLIREEKESEVELERERIKAKNEKFQSAMHALTKNGALEKLLMSVAAKVTGGPVPTMDQLNKVPIKKKPPRSEKTEPTEEDIAEITAQMERDLKEKPLYTYCMGMRSIFNDESNGVKKYIEDNFRKEIITNFDALLESEDEEDAKKNLDILKNSLEGPDLMKLQGLQGMLTENQQQIVMQVVMFDTGGEEETE